MLKMEQATHEICSENPSLFTLNDDCIREIFAFLQLEDFVQLAVTCTRLLWVSKQCKKYKNIAVTRNGNGSFYTVEQFAKILAVIGGNVASLDVRGRAFEILKTIADTQSGITELDSYYTGEIDGQSESCESKSLQGLPFRNLKKLRFWVDNHLSTDGWRNLFENNRRIECLEYWDRGVNKCLPLLQMLSELKSLTIYELEIKPEEFHHLSGLRSLTKLSFWSGDTCYNQLLVELAEKLNLVELEFYMPCDAETFAVVKSFRHLEVLSMVASNLFCPVPENTMFPTMLKKIKLEMFGISCSNFLSIVKQLTFLEEFSIGYGGRIFWDNDEAEYFCALQYGGGATNIQGSKIIAPIAKKLRVEKRKLKIIVNTDYREDETECKYSDYLEIIRRLWDDEWTFDHTFRLQ